MDQEALNRHLRYYARLGGVKDVEELIARGADVNSRSDDGKSPLILAAMTGNYRVGEFLLRNGANPNERDDLDYTALHFASFSCSVRFIELLLLFGADVNWANHALATPLMYSVIEGCIAGVERLMRHPEINPSLKDMYYKTARDYIDNNTNLGDNFELAIAFLNKDFRGGHGPEIKLKPEKKNFTPSMTLR